MNRLTASAAVIACALALAALGGRPGLDAAPAREPSQVEVTNFPAVQQVAGQVAVANLPATQNVQVQNLPLDGTGALRVTGNTEARIHVVGITAATFAPSGSQPPGVLTLNRACAAEFPNTRICALDETFRSIPPAPEWTDEVWIVERWDQALVQPHCYTSDGVSVPCKLEISDTGLHPALCCGY